MTAETLSLSAGIVLSLLFSYIPGANTWFGKQTGVYKRLIMLGLLAVTSAVTFGIACLGWGETFGISFVCEMAGAVELFKVFALAAIANQTTFLISPKRI